jgi:hypothetical protein
VDTETRRLKIILAGDKAERCKQFMSTADVVPKSEVEELIGKFECFLCHVTGGRLSKHTYDLGTMETVATDCINETYNDGYDEGYKDCAREIFEEIEELAKIYTFPVVKNGFVEIAKEPFWCIEPSDLAELKKKYTEDKKYEN